MNDHPAVLWPSHKHGLEFTPDAAVWIVQRMVGTLPDEEYDPLEEPTQHQIDEWMIGMMDDDGCDE
jgi:hypothetical protein